MDTLENLGFQPTGEYSQLNSYENRVFEMALEKGSSIHSRIIVKVYRPRRWSQKQILEEHQFTQELLDHDLLTVPPLQLSTGTTLAEFQGLSFAVFPRFQGRMLQEILPEELKRFGSLLARMHNIGAERPARHRLRMDIETFGTANLSLLKNWVAPEVWHRYQRAAEQIFAQLEERLDFDSFHRIHGDFHRGNLLLKEIPGETSQLAIVDFDDFVMGPAAQDFWMLLTGDEDTFDREIDLLAEGYEEFREFPYEQVDLILGLRGLRIVSYAAWIARRYEDPVFPQLFPQFRDYIYWAEETEALERLAGR